MKKKLFGFLLAICLIVPSMFILTACDLFGGDEEVDATLHHLTLVYDDEVKNQEGFNQSDLKATYGYGSERYTEFPETPAQRDEDEIQALLEAGASQEDIDKAGVRQDDGCYYFFYQDPIYLNAPKVEGWKFLGFFATTNNTSYADYKTDLMDIDGQLALSRWNMDDEDVILEARYEKWEYEYYFNDMEIGDTNPNSRGDYCYIDDGVYELLPATSTNPGKKFRSWTYSKYVNGVWTKFDIDKLPADYYEDSMRIEADWTIDQFKIDFAFEHYIDPDNTVQLDFDEACESIMVQSNIATVNGESIPSGDKIEIDETSVLKIQYNSWLDVFVTPTSDYDIWYCKVNGNRYDLSVGYFSFDDGDITKDATITIVLSTKVA